MKTEVLMALLGVSSAVKLNDAPVYFNEPSWKQTWPSAAGLVQLDEELTLTACEQNPQPGVICDKQSKLFANGMVGNENLKQEISMKNVPYFYTQKGDNDKDITDRQTTQSCKCRGSGCEECAVKAQVARSGDKTFDAEKKSSGCACGGQGLCETCRWAIGDKGDKKSSGCGCGGQGLCETCRADSDKKTGGCSCGGSGLCETCKASLVQTGDYTDTMGYSTYVHSYAPGQFPPNFNIKQGGKCLEWVLDGTGRLGNDQHKLEFNACSATNHQQYFNFHQMSRTIRAYSRQNFVISNKQGNNFVGTGYEAVLRPWRKEEYNILDFDLNGKCTMMNTDGEAGFGLTNTNGALSFGKCTGAAGQKFTIQAITPGKGSYP
jgi:hypothetical protein